jgi:D-proline reductase (dithiol) PrdB
MNGARARSRAATRNTMPRLEDLSDVQRQSLLNFPCFEHDTSPCTPLDRLLSEVKLALVTTAGLHLRGNKPFAPGDQTYRIIPSDAAVDDILQSHTSIGFDRTAFYRDANISFPIQRLRELVERGVVASLSGSFYSLLGAQENPRTIVEETGPEVARRLRDEGVDAVLLTPS